MSSVNSICAQPPIPVSSDLSDDVLIAICDAAEIIACQCPGYLVRLLREVRKFRQYTQECTQQFPQDQETHQWLTEQTQHVERLLSNIIWEFLEKENLLDEEQKLQLHLLAERTRDLVINQQLL